MKAKTRKVRPYCKWRNVGSVSERHENINGETEVTSLRMCSYSPAFYREPWSTQVLLALVVCTPTWQRWWSCLSGITVMSVSFGWISKALLGFFFRLFFFFLFFFNWEIFAKSDQGTKEDHVVTLLYWWHEPHSFQLFPSYSFHAFLACHL